MSPGGTDASLKQLVVGFFVAASLITVITMILRRRSGSQDLLGTQVREMEARASAAARPGANTRLRDAATGIAEARTNEAASRTPAPSDAPTSDSDPSNSLPSDGSAPHTPSPGSRSPAVAEESRSARDATAQDATAQQPTTQDPTAEERTAHDATTPPDGWPSAPGTKHDAMADTYAWLRIAALVQAGQREQAIELLSATMAISPDEAELLVNGLTDTPSEHRPD